MKQENIVSVKDCIWWSKENCEWTRSKSTPNLILCSELSVCTLKGAIRSNKLTGKSLRKAFEFNHNPATAVNLYSKEFWPKPTRSGTIINCPFPYFVHHKIIFEDKLKDLRGWNRAWQKLRAETRDELHRRYCPRQRLGELACRNGGLGPYMDNGDLPID